MWQKEKQPKKTQKNKKYKKGGKREIVSYSLSGKRIWLQLKLCNLFGELFWYIKRRLLIPTTTTLFSLSLSLSQTWNTLSLFFLSFSLCIRRWWWTLIQSGMWLGSSVCAPKPPIIALNFAEKTINARVCVFLRYAYIDIDNTRDR